MRWRLKSPASRLFTQAFIQVQIKENIKDPRHWPLRWSPVNPPHKGPVTRKMFPFDDVIMLCITGPLWKSTSDRWIPHKWPVMRNVSPCHGVIMVYIRTLWKIACKNLSRVSRAWHIGLQAYLNYHKQPRQKTLSLISNFTLSARGSQVIGGAERSQGVVCYRGGQWNSGEQPEPNRLTLCRRHFKCFFLKWKCLNCD